MLLFVAAACSKDAAPASSGGDEASASTAVAEREPAKPRPAPIGPSLGSSGNAASAVTPGAGSERKELRVGYQKNGVLVIARQQAMLERTLAPLDISVTWVEFTSGPPLLEAMNAGSIDLGPTGDVPPVFAQAAGAHVVYVAGQASTNGQGILVKPDAGIRTLADLKGKRVGFTKGSSAHNVVLLALEQAGLSYGDITPVYLSPPDAGAAFARGAIDAWAVWDPYFALGEKHGGQILVNGSALGQTHSFLLANREFAARNPRLLRTVIATLAEAAAVG
jgi:sulfonate transport system substrate-binding protein